MTGADLKTTGSVAPLRLVTLGGAELASPHGPVLGPGKPLALVVYLAFSTGHTASREFLIDLLWADLEGERARHALRQALWQLRQSLGDLALTGKEEVTLGLKLGSDRSEFLLAVECGDYEAALDLYRGPFLPAFATPGGVEFEHWADLERDRLRATFLRAAELLVRRKLGASQFREAQRIARRACEAAPSNELGWRLLLECLIAGRDYVSARAEADALESQASAEGRALEASTRAAIALARGASTLEGATAGTGLVAELIGREREFSRIIGAWDIAQRGPAQFRHIIAAAGLGKSRLLHDAEARMRAAGVRVVQVRANPGDRTISYSLAGDIARLVSELPGAKGISPASAASLVSLNPILSSSISAAPDPSTGDEALRRRTLALGEAIAATAEDTPFALFVDDLHWADLQSYRLLEGMIPRLDGARVLLVTASRPARDRRLDAAAGNPVCLEPLSVAQVQSLVTSLGRLPPEETWASGLAGQLHRGAGGSPLLILETLKLSLDEGVLSLTDQGWRCLDLTRLGDLLGKGTALKSRIASLGEDERRILTLVAVAGAPLTVALLTRAMNRGEGELEAAFVDLERRGLINRAGGILDVAHDEIGSAIMEAGGPSLREVEGVLGHALAEGTPDLLVAARAVSHLVRSGNQAEVHALFRRVALACRQGGDRRRFVTIASDLAGEGQDTSTARDLVRALPLRVRMGLWSRRRAGLAMAAVLMTVAGLVLGVWASRQPQTIVARTEAVLWRLQDSLRVETASALVSAEAWSGNRTLVVTGPWLREPERLLARSTQRVSYSPDGNSIAFVVARDNLNTDDIYIRGPRGVRAIVAGPGDDASPSWSPDGLFLAFTTMRWSPAGAPDYDVAVVDVATGTIRPVTTTRDHDRNPIWSPDGTRIAFVRQYQALRHAEVCWISVDAARGRCRRITGYEPGDIVGWSGSSLLIVQAGSDGTDVLLRIDPDSDDQGVLFDGAVESGTESVSADGRWLTCRCALAKGQLLDWIAFPVREPSQVRRIEEAGGSQVIRVSWRLTGWAETYADQVTLQAARPTVPLGATFRLKASIRDSREGEVSVPPAVMAWRSSDSTIASVDSMTGDVRPRRTGRVEIAASAGGWRQASVSLEVVPPIEAATVFSEDWVVLDTSKWKLFGAPLPLLDTGPDGVLGLNNNGDGSYESGAYSTAGLPAVNALGVEAMVSVPLSRSQGQAVRVELVSVRAITVDGWDHLSNAMPINQVHKLEFCTMNYPGGEGFQSLSRVVLRAGPELKNVTVDSKQMTAGWHRLRIQIFPDGTCGFALDGRVVFRSREGLPLDSDYRVILRGNAVGAKMITGSVVGWTGVRKDLDWVGGEGIPK